MCLLRQRRRWYNDDMPELPEVETVKRGLHRLLPRKQIVAVTFDWQKSFPNAPSDVKKFMIGAKVRSVTRRAKVLLIELDSGYSLVIHLKMTGQLVYVEEGKKQKAKSSRSKSEYIGHGPDSSLVRFGAGHPNSSLVGKLPDRSTRVVIDFGSAKLFFNDQRKFGWMRLLPTVEVPNINFFKKLGPEPLEAAFTADDFILRMRRRNKSAAKAVLLDQTVIAGVGNIYADESLFSAQIHPQTIVANLTNGQLAKLYTDLKDVLLLSIKHGGSTDKNYVDAEGNKGSYLTFANVFRKNGQPCPRCGGMIHKTRVAGRGTHLCPDCQTVEE